MWGGGADEERTKERHKERCGVVRRQVVIHMVDNRGGGRRRCLMDTWVGGVKTEARFKGKSAV